MFPSKFVIDWQALSSAAMCLVLVFSPGCGRYTRGGTTTTVAYSTLPPQGTQINVEAKRLNDEGLRAFDHGRIEKAEAFFRQSLEEDANFGPAHNNLGQLYLAQHQLYLAAWEFEYASNLMPGLVEPIVNQGLAYETAEMLDQAATYYSEAVAKNPRHAIAISSLARVRIKQGAPGDEIGYLLDQLILHDGREHWVQWAKNLRMTQYRKGAEDGCVDIADTPNASGQSSDACGCTSLDLSQTAEGASQELAPSYAAQITDDEFIWGAGEVGKEGIELLPPETGRRSLEVLDGAPKDFSGSRPADAFGELLKSYDLVEPLTPKPLRLPTETKPEVDDDL